MVGLSIILWIIIGLLLIINNRKLKKGDVNTTPWFILILLGPVYAVVLIWNYLNYTKWD